MYRSALVWLAICAPLALLSCWLALLVAAAVPIALFFALQHYTLRQAPKELAAPFRNIVIAHRGGQPLPAAEAGADGDSDPSALPENTLAAFRWASSAACNGADAIELDVWLSADGVPMVNHDPNVFRHYDGEGLISSLTCAQLKKLKLLPKPLLPVKNNEVHRAIHPDYLRTECMPTSVHIAREAHIRALTASRSQ